MTDIKNKITYISAGAGSGKTYKLTHQLADIIINEHIDPSQVIVATFTKKAAAELRERSQAVLYERGMYDAAAQMDRAVIGTIDSVAELFVRKYWYLLGLNAKLNVMDENDVSVFINTSMAEMTADADFLAALKTFTNFIDDFGLNHFDSNAGKVVVSEFWKDDLKSIIDSAIRSETTSFAESEEKSIAFLDSIIPPTDDRQFTLDEFQADCRYYYDRLESTDKKTLKPLLDASKLTVSNISKFLKFIESIQGKPRKITKVPDTPTYVAKYANLWSSSLVNNKIKEVIHLEFQLAEKWQAMYKQFKRDHSLIDFSDMESYFWQLLSDTARADIAAEISQYKYVFVDEFQDCNPMQVKIFSRLAELTAHSVWVGDAKQAIYGFRGTDTALTDAVAKLYGSDDNILDESHRSLPDLVNMVSKFFTSSFIGKFHLFDDDNKVVLHPLRPETEKGEDASLRGKLSAWVMPKDEEANIAINVAQMVHDGDAPSDIAVLTRSNSSASKIAAFLVKLGVPVCSSSLSSLSQCKEVCLLMSILSLIVDKSDSLSKSQIRFLTEPGMTVATIIDTRVEGLSRGEKEWGSDNPLISQIDRERKTLSTLPVAALVQSVITRFQLFNYVSRWGNAEVRKANLEQLVTAASQYESHCDMMTIGSSISGFIAYIDATAMPGASDDAGVFVDTYHKAKGLEWRTVILCSFENPSEQKVLKQTYFKVDTETIGDYENFSGIHSVIRYTPSIVGASSNLPAAVESKLTVLPDRQQKLDANLCEEARLMYVGFTRAKDHLILSLRKSISKLQSMTTASLTFPSVGESQCDILSTGFPFAVTTFGEIGDALSASAVTRSECQTVEISPSSSSVESLQPRYVSPSTLHVDKSPVRKVGATAARIDKNATYDRALLGDCIHNIFCLLRHDSPSNKSIAADLLFQNSMTVISAADVVATYHDFFAFLQQTYGPATAVYHELPFFYAADGQIVRGSMDFVYETPSGCILVDFKTNDVSEYNVLNDQDKPYYAGRFGGQFAAYARALTMSGKTVREKLIFYPVTGLIVHID